MKTIVRVISILLVAAASLTAAAEPTRASATARASARILPAPRVIPVSAVPERIEATADDLERGYVRVVVADHSRVALASGDRDEGRLEPMKDGVLLVRAESRSEPIEIVWHAE